MYEENVRRRWVLWLLALPFNLIIAWPWLLLLSVTFAVHKWRLEPGGVWAASWRPWAAEMWRYSTTLGHVIVYQPGAAERVHEHEHVHIRQGEDASLRAFLFGVLVLSFGGGWTLALCVWGFGYGWMGTNFLSTWMRGGNPYRDSEHERGAYAQTDLGPDGMSWRDRQ